MGEVVDLTRLAVFRRRVAGETRFIELAGGETPLVVQTIVPDGFTLAQAEAAAQDAIQAIRANAQTMVEYGFDPRVMTDHEVFALSKIITAVETAKLLWRDWNYAIEPAEGEPVVKAKLESVTIAGLMMDPDIRAAWMVQLDAMSPLERSEGNVSAASPDTGSDAAASIAPDAPGSERPAPEADASMESSAQG